MYVTLCAVKIDGELVPPNTSVDLEEEMRDYLLEKGAIAVVGSEAAEGAAMKANALGGEKASSSAKQKKPKAEIKHKFAFTLDQLKGKSLDELNVMIAEREPDIQPYDEISEARAHLMQDTKKAK